MNKLSKDYWNNRYVDNDIPWDLGAASPAIIDYVVKNSIPHEAKILIPGAGHSHEMARLYDMGFHNAFTCEWSSEAISKTKKRYPNIPESNFIEGDFFRLEGQYDYIIEQTFFCALDPQSRPAYVRQCHDLLKENGHLIGLLFAKSFEKEGPPFGGIQQEYLSLFKSSFKVKKMSITALSIGPRLGNEYFIDFQK